MRPSVPFTDLGAMTSEIRRRVEDEWSRLLTSSRFIGGPAVAEFEAAWAAYCGTEHAVGVANGTDALQLTLVALGIGDGDEVVVPANTFVASTEAVVLAGATPRFADVDPDTLLITAPDLEAAITPRTRAVIVVDLYGQVPNMDALVRTAERAGIVLIEDAAQAHGAAWDGRRAGSFGHAACFSFYPGKNLGAFGDAGAVTTGDAVLAERIRRLRDHGRVTGSHYVHDRVGTNSRLDAIQAVVLTAKLARLDAWNQARRAIMARYRAAFAASAASVIAEAPRARGVHHLAVIRVAHRDQVKQRLAERGVESGIHYPIPCHQQEPYSGFASMPLPVAETSAREVLSLPLFPHMTDGQVDRVIEAVHQALQAEEVEVA
jgi:dTDP-4-amino-4,6-dideoxygalactose transaminase